MPGSDRVAEPGFDVVTPGTPLIIIAPVSVCHQVSTMGQRFLPITSLVPHPGFGIDGLAHRAEQAKGREVVFLRMLVACRMKARMAVGAV